MMVVEKYPANLKPLNKLVLCSNTFLGDGKVLVIKNYAPIVIGDGIVPSIWITVKVNNEIIPVVTNNKSSNPNVKVDIYEQLREVKIFGDGTLLIHAKMTAEKECVVNELDFRPLGLNIHGDCNVLNLASNKLTNNIFGNNDIHIVLDN